MKKNHSGFSLIELMIVVTIIGILTAIALPSYQNYTQRARFAEVMIAAEPFKIAIALALQRGVTLSDLNTGTNGIPSSPPTTKNLASLSVENGIITAISTDAAGKASYILKPNIEGNTWTIEGSCLTTGLCNS